MENSSNPPSSATSTGLTIKDLPEEFVARLTGFLSQSGVSASFPDECQVQDFFSDVLRVFLKLQTLQPGRVTCILTPKPAIFNFYRTLHGGVVASVAEMVSTACARTVVGEDKEIFLGEQSISYLSAVPEDVEVVVDGSVVRSGRNLTVVAVEFKIRKTGRLAYTARSTFYNTAVSKL